MATWLSSQFIDVTAVHTMHCVLKVTPTRLRRRTDISDVLRSFISRQKITKSCD